MYYSCLLYTSKPGWKEWKKNWQGKRKPHRWKRTLWRWPEANGSRLTRPAGIDVYKRQKVLGFTYKQTMWHIILPQVVKRVIPPLGNEVITLLKDTSLVYVLAMNDLMRVTRALVQRDVAVSYTHLTM